MEWIRIQPGNAVGRHMLAEKQVVMVFNGAMEITLNEPGAAVPVQVGTGEVLLRARRCLADAGGDGRRWRWRRRW